jgi:hypothetical protein
MWCIEEKTEKCLLHNVYAYPFAFLWTSCVRKLWTIFSDTSIRWRSPYNRPPRALWGCRGIAVLVLDLGARWGGWSASCPGRFTPGKDSIPIVQKAGWAPGQVWTCAKYFAPTGIRSPDCPARRQSLYRLSYLAHTFSVILSLLSFRLFLCIFILMWYNK